MSQLASELAPLLQALEGGSQQPQQAEVRSLAWLQVCPTDLPLLMAAAVQLAVAQQPLLAPVLLLLCC